MTIITLLCTTLLLFSGVANGASIEATKGKLKGKIQARLNSDSKNRFLSLENALANAAAGDDKDDRDDDSAFGDDNKDLNADISWFCDEENTVYCDNNPLYSDSDCSARDKKAATVWDNDSDGKPSDDGGCKTKISNSATGNVDSSGRVCDSYDSSRDSSGKPKGTYFGYGSALACSGDCQGWGSDFGEDDDGRWLGRNGAVYDDYTQTNYAFDCACATMYMKGNVPFSPVDSDCTDDCRNDPCQQPPPPGYTVTLEAMEFGWTMSHSQAVVEWSVTTEVESFQSTSTSETNDFGLEVSQTAEYEYAGVEGSTSVTASYGLSMYESVTNDLLQRQSSHMTCSANDCDGMVYQWQVDGGEEATMKSCIYQCMESDHTKCAESAPVCPPGFCGSSTCCDCCKDTETLDAIFGGSRPASMVACSS